MFDKVILLLMALDPRRLLLFRSIARSGSLSAGARELGLTQPAVSQQLRQLERQAGNPLLLRTSRGVALTEAGAALLARADAVAGQLHMAEQELAELAELRSGRVRLVAFPSAAATLVPAALHALWEHSPGLALTLVEAEPPDALAALQAGEADVAVVFAYGGPPTDEGQLGWLPLFVEPVHLVLPATADGARRTPATGWLSEQTWIAGCPRCRQHLLDSCRAAGFEPRVMHESDDYVVVQNLVARGLGITVLPELALRAFRHPDVRVHGGRRFGPRHVGLAYRLGAENVPGNRAVIEELVAQAAALMPE